MRAAPPVLVQLSDDPVSRFVVAGVGALSALCGVFWVMARSGWPGAQTGWAAGLLVIGSVAGAGLAWNALPGLTGSLAWDGRQWMLKRGPEGGVGETDGQAGAVSLLIDTGAWMLLRFEPVGGPGTESPATISLRRKRQAGAWHALRCAVHAANQGAPSSLRTDA